MAVVVVVYMNVVAVVVVYINVVVQTLMSDWLAVVDRCCSSSEPPRVSHQSLPVHGDGGDDDDAFYSRNVFS